MPRSDWMIAMLPNGGYEVGVGRMGVVQMQVLIASSLPAGNQNYVWALR